MAADQGGDLSQRRYSSDEDFEQIAAFDTERNEVSSKSCAIYSMGHARAPALPDYACRYGVGPCVCVKTHPLRGWGKAQNLSVKLNKLCLDYRWIKF